MRRTWKAGIASVVAVAFLLPVAPTSAGDTYQGKWRGKTEDDERIVFKVNPKGELKRFRARYTAFGGDLCRSVNVLLNIKDLEEPIEDDAFKFRYLKEDFPSEGVVRTSFARVRGTFDSAEKAAGKMKITYRVVSGGVFLCNAFETFKWKAHKL